LFGLLGAIGCLLGWIVGEGFLLAFLPGDQDSGGSLASKPAAPALTSMASTPATPTALPALLKGSAESQTPPAAPPRLPAGNPTTAQAPAAPPKLIAGKSSSTAPPPPPEFAKRLALAGAKTGDVQISLIWFNVNDLDLHCIDPRGEFIYYARSRSSTGGTLDVDMNGAGPTTNRPVENIYWPKGAAPLGKYQVFVHHYANHGAPDPTSYKVNVLIGGERREFEGTVSARQPRKLIGEFEMKPPRPDFQIAVSPELIINQGNTNQLPIRIVGASETNPVRLQLEGDLRGVSPKEFTIPAGRNDATIEIVADARVPLGARTLTVKAVDGTLRAESSFRLTIRESPPELRLGVSPELIVPQGGKNQLLVRVARIGFAGPVVARLEGNLDGITPVEFTVPAEKDEATFEINIDAAERRSDRFLGIKASSGALKAESDFWLKVRAPRTELLLAASPSLVVNPGAKNRFEIRLARTNFPGPVRATLVGDLEGISPKEFVIPAGETRVAFDLEAAASAPKTKRALVLRVKEGDVEADSKMEVTIRDPEPGLRMAIPPAMDIFSGSSNALPVRIARDRFTGPVTIKLEGDLDGLSPHEFTIPADADEQELTLAAGSDARAGARSLRVTASGGGISTSANVMLTLSEGALAGSAWSWGLVLVIGIWTALLAIGLSLALVMGQNWYLAKPLLSPAQLLMILAGGFGAGLVAGGVGQTLYGLMRGARLVPEIGFLAGWLLLGGLLGRGLVFFIPNLSAWRATVAGSCGGFLGASAFLAVSAIGDVAGRFMGAAILGFALGLIVAIIEMAFRQIWLEVAFGPGETRVVNLGATPVVLGGDGRKCTICVKDAPGMALKFWEKDGQILCLDVLAEKTFPVATGYRRTLKGVEVSVCSNEKGTRAPAFSPAPASPPRKAPPSSASPRPEPRPASAPKAVQAPPPKPAPIPKAVAPISATPPRSAPAVSSPQPKPTKPASQSSNAVSGACPMCGDVSSGEPGKRRCPGCYTMF